MKLLFTLLFTSSLFAEVTRTQVLMGTFGSITLEEKNKTLFSGGFSKLKEVEDSLSSYAPHAKIYQLNDQGQVALDAHTYKALQLSKHYYEKTDGYFDITIGRITKELFAFGKEHSFIPHAKVLEQSITGWNSLFFDDENAYVANGVKVDLGGMGKGYGVDEVATLFKTHGVEKSVIAISGDIRCLGECEVAIQNPFADGVVAILKTKHKEMGISTSGNYRRYVKSKKANHLINPHAKKSAWSFASVTLVSHMPNADIDAYATAVSVMSVDKALVFLEKMKLGYVLITTQKEVYVSKNLDALATLSWAENIERQEKRYIEYTPHKE